MRRIALTVYGCVLIAGVVTGQEARPSQVYSAHLENLLFHPEPGIVSFDIVNDGDKTITAFSVRLFCRTVDGPERSRGSAGQDMIQAPEPPPGTKLSNPQSTFGSIQPHSRRRTGRSVSNCPDLRVPAIDGRAELSAIVFDDGTGEGDAAFIRGTLDQRRAVSEELNHWIARFSELKQTPGLLALATKLYKDLTAASYEAEQDPDGLATNHARTKRFVRQQLQDLALELTQFAKTHQSLGEVPAMAWRITDLERRAERVTLGAGRSATTP